MRVRRILEMIRLGTRTGRCVNRTDMCRELEVSPRTAMRDLDVLRDQEGAPIDYDASRKGYYLSDETWSLPAVTLSRRQLFGFSIARRVLAAYRGTPFEKEMVTALDRVASQIEGPVTVDLASLTDRFLVLGDDYAPVDPDRWAALAKAVDQQEQVRVEYQKFNGEQGVYNLEPVHLVAYHGDWYVLARRVGETAYKTFAVSRVHDVEGTGNHFYVPEGFDASAHFSSAFGIVRGERPIRVRLLFSPKVATYIEGRVWHATQQCRRRRDGALDFSMQTGGWHEVVRWVLSWQPDVRVLSPKVLRDRVEEKMRIALGGQG